MISHFHWVCFTWVGRPASARKSPLKRDIRSFSFNSLETHPFSLAMFGRGVLMKGGYATGESGHHRDG